MPKFTTVDVIDIPSLSSIDGQIRDLDINSSHAMLIKEGMFKNGMVLFEKGNEVIFYIPFWFTHCQPKSLDYFYNVELYSDIEDTLKERYKDIFTMIGPCWSAMYTSSSYLGEIKEGKLSIDAPLLGSAINLRCTGEKDRCKARLIEESKNIVSDFEREVGKLGMETGLIWGVPTAVPMGFFDMIYLLKEKMWLSATLLFNDKEVNSILYEYLDFFQGKDSTKSTKRHHPDGKTTTVTRKGLSVKFDLIDYDDTETEFFLKADRLAIKTEGLGQIPRLRSIHYEYIWEEYH